MHSIPSELTSGHCVHGTFGQLSIDCPVMQWRWNRVRQPKNQKTQASQLPSLQVEPMAGVQVRMHKAASPPASPFGDSRIQTKLLSRMPLARFEFW
jgi:hypothetical protein